jgi:DNA (cytosine-5)-methyltransferase 1
VALSSVSNFTYKWNLTDLESVEKNGLNVFSCFACGGGSTMGYKMSGFNVIGCNEIDPEMIEIYKKNHNPKYAYLESIETFKLREDLPRELYNLDILDGSPPCSSFSMAGSREKKWGVKKKFREGQAEQVLDDLFFHYIDLARKLQPKVVIAENVKGMLQGNAKGYVKQIINLFNVAGYDVQLFLLNGATMGLPQERERVFFVARRRDLGLPPLKIGFNEKRITVKDATGLIGHTCNSANIRHVKNNRRPKWWTHNRSAPTIMGTNGLSICENGKWRELRGSELCPLGSFPADYIFKSDKLAGYQIGMSVPPLMMHKLSEQIYKQWFDASLKSGGAS